MTNQFMLAVTLALLASPAMAQDVPAGFDSRWTPYLGCWAVAQEQMGQQPISVPAGTMVCVTPSGRAGVTIKTTVDGKNVLEQTIVADGSAQPLSQSGCGGTQASDWSRDGERLFTKVSLECTGRPARTVTGITMLAKGHWVDVQATVSDGDHDLRVRRYRRAGGEYTGAPAFAHAPLNVEDIIEASAKVQGPAVEVALDELGGRFTLNSRALEQLADGGVSPNVIDLMVAQAYPDRFEVDRGVYPAAPYATGASSGSASVMMGSSAYPYPIYEPFYSSYYYYSPFAYPYYWGSSYRYRYGYPFYPNYYNYNYYGYPGSIYSGGGSAGSGNNAQPGSPDSRGGTGIATGRGYTRVRPSGSSDSGQGAAPSNRGGSVGRTRGVDSSDSSGSSGASSGSSSSGGSSGGNSGGGNSGRSGGRTAQPR